MTDATCYIRKAWSHSVDGAGTNAKWKIYWDLRVGDYTTKLNAYTSNIDSNWSTFETKGKLERKRVADVALYTKEKGKAEAAATAYKSATLDGVETTKTTKENEKNTAYGKITDLAYYQKVDAQTTAKAAYDAAVTKNTALTDKIARVEAILKHMKDGDKGTIPELNAKK